jgi:uncharacterized protein YpuA (DUF1002 family)
MSKVLERCKAILANKRCSDNTSIERLVSAVARQMKVSVTDGQLQRAVTYLKYGCVIW